MTLSNSSPVVLCAIDLDVAQSRLITNLIKFHPKPLTEQEWSPGHRCCLTDPCPVAVVLCRSLLTLSCGGERVKREVGYCHSQTCAVLCCADDVSFV